MDAYAKIQSVLDPSNAQDWMNVSGLCNRHDGISGYETQIQPTDDMNFTTTIDGVAYNLANILLIGDCNIQTPKASLGVSFLEIYYMYAAHSLHNM